MPHIVIEHSGLGQNLDLASLSIKLHNTLSGHETINLAAIKTRTIESSHANIGTSSMANKFIHITLLLLPGRSDELKLKIVKNLYDDTLLFLTDKNCSVSVETRDLGVYFKG